MKEKVKYKNIFRNSLLYSNGYRINVPKEFINRFVDNWNKHCATKINKRQAHCFILALLEALVIIFDNKISVFFKDLCLFKVKERDIKLSPKMIKTQRIAENIVILKTKILGKVSKMARESYNTSEEYQQYLKEKQEVRELFLQQRMEDKKNASKW